MVNRIRELRVQKKLTQEGLALAVGTTQTQISKLEHGKLVPPGDLILSLVKLFGVSADYLLGISNYPHNVDKYLSQNQINAKEHIFHYDKLTAEDKRFVDKMTIFLEKQYDQPGHL